MKRKKLKDRYRRFPLLSDWGGIKSAIGEMRGRGYPDQPKLNKEITPENAHDKEACYKRVARSTRYCIRNYHIFIYGCGLCATRVPCESGIPDKLQGSISKR